jgi:hypothetical protein
MYSYLPLTIPWGLKGSLCVGEREAFADQMRAGLSTYAEQGRGLSPLNAA